MRELIQWFLWIVLQLPTDECDSMNGHKECGQHSRCVDEVGVNATYLTNLFTFFPQFSSSLVFVVNVRPAIPVPNACKKMIFAIWTLAKMAENAIQSMAQQRVNVQLENSLVNGAKWKPV
jgi:hypothetical protein